MHALQTLPRCPLCVPPDAVREAPTHLAHAACRLAAPPAAASTNATYKSTVGNTYTIFNQHLTQSAAERACNDVGGHLAAYNNLNEQKEVEQYYLTQGLLLSSYHKHYWMGLGYKSSAWTWMDKAIPGERSPALFHKLSGAFTACVLLQRLAAW